MARFSASRSTALTTVWTESTSASSNAALRTPCTPMPGLHRASRGYPLPRMITWPSSRLTFRPGTVARRIPRSTWRGALPRCISPPQCTHFMVASLTCQRPLTRAECTSSSRCIVPSPTRAVGIWAPAVGACESGRLRRTMGRWRFASLVSVMCSRAGSNVSES